MKRIVIVDDDNGIEHALTTMLETDGYMVDVYAGADDIFANNYITLDIFLVDRRRAGVEGL